jgi:endonuclease/exonuclease/phosphatase family metal-dependent hydrolase
MTFNIRYGTAKDGENHWDKRKHMVFDVIRKYSPDALGLQEAWDFQIAEIIEALPEYAFIGYSREGKEKKEGEYSCILYKKDEYSITEEETFWLSETPKKPSTSWGNQLKRICTKVKLTHKQTKQNFYLYNTHFDHRSQPSKVKSAEFMISKMNARLSAAPIIFMGDLNSGINSQQVKYLQKNSQLDLVDTHFVLHPNDPSVGTFSGFKFGQFKNKIDYIFTEKGAAKVLKSEIIRYSVNKRYPSDHFPIYTVIQFK